MILHPKLNDLFSGFNREGVTWSLLRLPSIAGGSGGDIDLLIAREDIPAAYKVLEDQGFSRLPGWKPGLHYLLYDLPTDSWLWIHAVTELSFGRFSLLHTNAEQACLVRRQRDGVIYSLRPEDAFWVTLLHCLFDKGKIAAHHRVALQDRANASVENSPLAHIVGKTCPPGWGAGRIVELVCQADWRELEGFAPILAKHWMRYQQIGAPQILRKKIYYRFVRLLNLFRSRGVSVALIGPDGAGKSTLIVAIQEGFILPVRPVYMGLTGGWLRHVDRLSLPFLVIPGRLLVFWGRYLLAQYHQLCGRLVVFDRYLYDYAVPTPYPLNTLQRAYRWIDGHACPGPDLTLILDAPGEIMFRRKGEYSPEMLEDWRQHFLAIRSRVKKSEIVDTTGPIEEVRGQVIHRIWQCYARRWKES